MFKSNYQEIFHLPIAFKISATGTIIGPIEELSPGLTKKINYLFYEFLKFNYLHLLQDL